MALYSQIYFSPYLAFLNNFCSFTSSIGLVLDELF